MKSPVFQIVTLSFALFFLAISCSDDKAREAAVAEAQQAATTEQTQPPTQKPATGTATETATVGTLNLDIPGKTAAKNSETCVAVTARNFNGIVSMQYSMKWDKNVLKFKRVQGFNLPGLSANNFGVQLVEKEGILTYSWFDANVRGISRPDGANLYEVCFDVVGEAGSKSSIQFTDVPTVKEISNSNSQFLDLGSAGGMVEVK
jgi:hypothetical protein